MLVDRTEDSDLSDVTLDDAIILRMDPYPAYLHAREYASAEEALQAFEKANGYKPPHPITATRFTAVSKDALVASGYGLVLVGDDPQEVMHLSSQLGGKQTFLSEEESLGFAKRHMELKQENGR